MRDIQIKPDDTLDRDIFFNNLDRNIKDCICNYPNIFDNLNELFVMFDKWEQEHDTELSRRKIVMITACAVIEMMSMANPPECIASIFGENESV